MTDLEQMPADLWEDGEDAARWIPEPAPRPWRPARVEHRGEERWPLAHAPDVAWTHAGVECAIALGWMNWNGYCRLPKRHPWRWRDKFDIPAQVHGGVTFGPQHGDYSEPLPASALGGWVGFDTAHAFDHWPDSELPELPPALAKSRRLLNGLTEDRDDRWRVTWSRQRLVDEVEALAEQIAAVPLERPVQAARRRRLATQLRTLERRRARRRRQPA